MARRLLKLLLVACPLVLLMGSAWILFWGPESHRGNVDYLRWKYGVGPYSEDIVPNLVRHDRGFAKAIVGKNEAWIRGRFPELSSSLEYQRYLRERFNCPRGEIYQVGRSCIYIVMEHGKGVGIECCKGT